MESLTAEEARVVGCLVEKQRTVPDTYPLTLHALVAACNQSSSRDPVVDYGEQTVLQAIDGLKAKGMARMVHPATGQRVTKYRHVLDEALGLDAGGLAALAVLLLRGPQSAAEVRSRTDRLHTFGSSDEVDATLDELAASQLIIRDGRRWRQTLCPSDHPAPVAMTPADDGPTVTRSSLEARVAKLEEEVALLRQALLE